MKMRSKPAERAAALWHALRVAGTDGLTAVAGAEAIGASAPYCRRAFRLWTEAGHARHRPPATAARHASGRYVMAADAPDAPPILTAQGEVLPREGYMSAREFAAIRAETGLDKKHLAILLRLDKNGRAVARIENGEQLVDRRTAERMSALRSILAD